MLLFQFSCKALWSQIVCQFEISLQYLKMLWIKRCGAAAVEDEIALVPETPVKEVLAVWNSILFMEEK